MQTITVGTLTACVLLVATPLPAQVTAPPARLRLVPRDPAPKAPALKGWTTSFAAAAATAKEKQQSMLLWFTAKW